MKKSLSVVVCALLLVGMLAGCGGAASSAPAASTPPASAPSSAPEPAPESEAAESAADDDSSSIPSAFPKEELTPICANQIENGSYAIEVTSSSSMFKIVDAQLTVEDDSMSAVLTLSGTGYEKLYMGTGEEALADSDDACIYFVEDGEGMYTYEVPVEALDMETDVAAWSIRKQEWYDRVCVFLSGGIPAEAITAA